MGILMEYYSISQVDEKMEASASALRFYDEEG